MSKCAKIWLITAVLLILTGGIIFGGVMSVLKWNFKELSTNKYVENIYNVSEEFTSISVDTDTSDILFIPTENLQGSVTCYEQKKVSHSVSVKDGVLTVETLDTRKWYDHIGINFSAPSIKIYIPRGEYGALSVKTDTGDIDIPEELKFKSIDIKTDTGDVTNYASASETIKVKTSTGKIQIEDISAASLDLSVTTGNVTLSGGSCDGDIKIKVSTGKSYLTDVICKSLLSSGRTGDISLKNVTVSEKLSIERSTGGVSFESLDADEIFVKTDTGDVTGTLRSEKVFITKTDTGRVSVPDSVTGGRCEISTDTGNIKISIVP